jgi:pimeloyl-ACP methyl ester carboxylesterase
MIYSGDSGPLAIREANDVLAHHPLIGMVRPLTCRWPDGSDPTGVVLFCHGLGSNGGEYAAMSSHWARHGYLVIHPTFADSIQEVARAEPSLGLDPDADLTGWTAMPAVRARMHEILHTPSRWLERLATVGAVMDALPEILDATCGRPRGTLPAAIAGHSFGAYTAQLLAGAEIDLPDDGPRSFRDRRFQAALLLSAQGRDQQGLRDGSWNTMDGPVLTVTGTLDQGAKGGDWRWKSEPYELAPAGAKYLAVLDDSDHFLGGFADRGGQRQVPAQKQAVEQLTLAVLDAHLLNRRAALDWLAAIDGRIGQCPVLFKHK